MPELPEVETMCRGVRPIVGSEIVGLVQPRSHVQPIAMRPPLATFRRGVVGRTITAVERAGKRVVVRLTPKESSPTGKPPSDHLIIFEPRMSGLVLLANPPNQDHLRLVFELRGGTWPELLFWSRRGLGAVSLLSERRFAQECGPGRLGPDALAISADELRGRMEKSGRAIKVALMDQRTVAGVGNLYASEILHVARIHPETPCHRLRKRDWREIHLAMNEVLELAILHQGSTLRDGTYRINKETPGGFQTLHRVYQRVDERCVTCNRGLIRRLVQTQRSTFFCPICQRARAIRSARK